MLNLEWDYSGVRRPTGDVIHGRKSRKGLTFVRCKRPACFRNGIALGQNLDVTTSLAESPGCEAGRTVKWTRMLILVRSLGVERLESYTPLQWPLPKNFSA